MPKRRPGNVNRVPPSLFRRNYRALAALHARRTPLTSETALVSTDGFQMETPGSRKNFQPFASREIQDRAFGMPISP